MSHLSKVAFTAAFFFCWCILKVAYSVYADLKAASVFPCVFYVCMLVLTLGMWFLFSCGHPLHAGFWFLMRVSLHVHSSHLGAHYICEATSGETSASAWQTDCPLRAPGLPLSITDCLFLKPYIIYVSDWQNCTFMQRQI